jgi:hypothetical protein
VTTKSSIRNWGVLYKSGVYALKALCLTPGDLPCALGSRVRRKLAEGRAIDPDRMGEVSRRHSVCLAAHVSGGLESHSARGPGSISKGGGNASLAEVGDSFGGQGVHREVESEGFAENHRVVIDGIHPEDEPVGQRWGMVEPALWRRRRLGSTSSYQGVCGRHGGEEACVTQGGLVLSEGKVWSRYCDTRRRKGGKRGKQTSTWSCREVGADISEMRSSDRCGARIRIGE